MATPLSQVKYWLEGATANGEAEQAKEGAEGATYLSYDVFLGLSVLGGFFALDHLYLRSPATFVAKFFINIFCFGVWWIYDALQAVFNADTVKLYGLGIPGWGPTGIGAGVLTKPVPDKKHMRFLFYSAALFFGGLIGLDSFVVGDRQTGIIRLLCVFSVIFLPVALLWWVYEIFQFFTNTKEVIGTHHEFFGAPFQSTASRMSSRFPMLGWLFSPLEAIKSLINNIVGPALISPLVGSIDAVTGTIEHAVSTVDNTVQLGREAVAKSGEIVEQVGKTLNTLSQASTLLPAASLYTSAQQALQSTPQSGGSLSSTSKQENLNPLGFILLGTLALISVSGFVVTWYRNRHESAREQSIASQDDAPPQPGVL